MFSRFLLIVFDESNDIISGCGIDKSVQLVRDLSSLFNIDLMDRSQLYTWKNEQVVTTPINELAHEYAKDERFDDQLVFNTMVKELGELRNGFIVPFSQSPFMRLV